MLSEQEVKKFKQLLEAELKKVEAELKTVGRINPANPKDWEPIPENMDTMPADDNEVADNIEAFEENTGILKELEIRFNEIRSALAKIDGGGYGICEIAKEPIEKDRLEANPAARTCKKHISR